MTVFSYGFVQHAVLAALLTGLAAPAVGTYLVQRRLALMGDGIGHVAVTGVGLGLLTGTAPLLTAVIVAVAGAVAIELLRERGRATGDVALALLFYGGLASGVLVTGLAGESTARLTGYLFGSLTTVSTAELWLVGGLSVAVVTVSLGLSPQLFAVCQDEEFAKVCGLRVRWYIMLTSAMAAVSVTVAMRTVGLLLVSALMVVPVATAQQVTRGFRVTLLAAMALGAGASLAGVFVSLYVDVAPGASIVLLALTVFALASPVGQALQRRRRVTEPFATDTADEVPVPTPHISAARHGHEHGPNCGHPAVPHGDHYDYVHDGHRHAAHDDHYDEH